MHSTLYLLLLQIDPYQWTWLPEAQIPFSKEAKNLVYDQLSDSRFVEELTNDLHKLFSVSFLLVLISFFIYQYFIIITT